MEPIIGFLIILLINVLGYAVIFFSINSTFKEKEKGLRGQIYDSCESDDDLNTGSN